MLCIWCGWGFSSSQELVQHMAMHMQGDAGHQAPPSLHTPAPPWQDTGTHMAMYMHGRGMAEQPGAWPKPGNLVPDGGKPPTDHSVAMAMPPTKAEHSLGMAVGRQEPPGIAQQRAMELAASGDAVARGPMKPLSHTGTDPTTMSRPSVVDDRLAPEPIGQLYRDLRKSSDYCHQASVGSQKTPPINVSNWPGHIMNRAEPPGMMNSRYGQPQHYPPYSTDPTYGEPVPREYALSGRNLEPLNIPNVHRPHYDYRLSNPSASLPLPAPTISHQMLPVVSISHSREATSPSAQSLPSINKQTYMSAHSLLPNQISVPMLHSSDHSNPQHHYQPAIVSISQPVTSTPNQHPSAVSMNSPEPPVLDLYPPSKAHTPMVYKEPADPTYHPVPPANDLPCALTDHTPGPERSFTKDLQGPSYGPVHSTIPVSCINQPPSPTDTNPEEPLPVDVVPLGSINATNPSPERPQSEYEPILPYKSDLKSQEKEPEPSVSLSPVPNTDAHHLDSKLDNEKSAVDHTKLDASTELTAEEIKQRILADLEQLPPYVNPNKCTVCGREFTVPASLRRHMIIHKDGDENPKSDKESQQLVYSCEVCQKEYHHLGSLKKHRLSHKLASGVQLEAAELEGMHRCSFCSKIYSRADKLQHHLLSHRNEFQFKCKGCQQRFVFAEQLEEHEAAPCTKRLKSDAGEDEVPARRTRSSVNSFGQEKQKATKGKAKANQNGGDKFYCMVCKKTFRKVAALENHVKLFETPSSNACSQCHMVFTSKASKKQHEGKHEAKVVHCPSCQKGFKREIYFIKHCQNSRCVRSEKKVSCEKCKETVIFRDYLSHLRSHEGKTMHTCPRCHKSYSSLLALQKHKHTCGTVRKTHKVERIKTENLAPADVGAMKIDSTARPNSSEKLSVVPDGKEPCLPISESNCRESRQSPESLPMGRTLQSTEPGDDVTVGGSNLKASKAEVHKCRVEKCVALFRSASQLKRHMRFVHTSLESAECHICKKRYSSKRSLTTHMVVHGGDKKHRCQYCPMAFSLANSLKLHVLRHTGQRPHKCPLCDATYITSNDLNLHVKKHGVPNPFTCSACQEAFPSRKVLDYHMKVHQAPAAPKTHSCPVCQKTFSTKRTATCHLRTHTGERPLQCQYCQKRFNWLSTYKKHLSSHTGKTHGCPVCRKSFHQQALLKEHMRVHTGERPFVCQVCGKGFTNRRCFNQHMRVHGEKRHLCPLCGTKFSEVYYLNRHMKVHADVFPAAEAKPRNN